MRRSIAILMLLILGACDGEMNGIACTEEARSSITLKILDSVTSQPLEEATITYTVDGGNETVTTCTDAEEFVDDCGLFPIAYEVVGTFDITVSSASYTDRTRSTIITKTSDGCHVVGKILTFNMTP